MEPEENKTQTSSNVPFNPKKLPTYIGLFAKPEALPKIQQFIVEGVGFLANTFKNDKVINEAYEKFISDSSPFELISDPHVTSLFIGGNASKTKSEHFTTFQPGHKMDLEIVGFIIVPGKIVTGICYPDQSVIKIENEFPHVTLMKGSWAPKFSNDLMMALCGKNGPLQKEYQKQEFAQVEEFTFKETVKIGKGSDTAYVVIRKPHLVLKVEARPSN